jgi:arylsulfatase A
METRDDHGDSIATAPHTRGPLPPAHSSGAPARVRSRYTARGDEPRGRRPNILVILCDDLGYGDLGCFGHPTIRTPHLDRLAAQGMRLTSCYAAAPVCSPSRAGLLTGRAPVRLGVYDWIAEGSPMHLGKGELTVATLLKRAGYATCHVGKWHCNGRFNSPEQPQPGDHGFEHRFSTQNNAAPSHENPTNFVRDGRRVGPLRGYSCQLVADEAIGWLRSDVPGSCAILARRPSRPHCPEKQPR